MAKWHLEELYDALTAKGWSIEEPPGDDYRISGRWKVTRSTREPSLIIEFEGQDDMVCLPMERAYGCCVRRGLSLYFSRRGGRWKEHLREFVNNFCPADLRPLIELMSEISKRCWCAGWMEGTEDVLWRAVQDGPLHWGHGDIMAEDIASLKALSESVGGWIYWDDDATEATYIPMDEWVSRRA